MVVGLTPAQFLERRGHGEAFVLLDVREVWETVVAPVPIEHRHIPMGEIPDRLAELETDLNTVVICHAGSRSMEVARYLERRGFRAVFNLTGGIDAWSRDVNGTIPRY
ncbi:MAG: sulfurtransferase [Gammaproteobacteria bacterium]|nr:sulfurtransferase [Gammaproteobacteria bacterium]MDE2349962.1 sulfurtransferase [Gammaproteobacteria bacterium]